MQHVKHYRKKVESVQALQLSPASIDEAVRWTGGRRVEEKNPFDEDQITVGLNIPTMEGVVRASEGDYILQSWEGGFKVMSQQQFEELYERPTRG